MFLFFCVYDDVFKLSIYDHNRLEMISNQNCIVCREEEKKIETVYFSNMIVTQQQYINATTVDTTTYCTLSSSCNNMAWSKKHCMTVYEKNFLLFLFVEETIVFCGIGTGGIQYFLTVIAKSNLLRVYSGSLSLDKLCTRQGQHRLLSTLKVGLL